MSGVVVFDWSAFAARYPELAGSITSLQAQLYFNEATLYCDNGATSPVCDLTQRAVLLNMLTAHVCALNAPLCDNASSPLVGRISQATEGSVSVQTQNDYPPGTVQWFQQTKYGAAFWAASAGYRTGQYSPGPFTPLDPFLGVYTTR